MQHSDAERFTRSEPIGDEPVVLDSVTGLMWQGCVAGFSGSACATGTMTSYTWQEALAHCEGEDWGGYTDWYLPNAKELRSIVDDHRYDPSIDTVAFMQTPSSQFWSSTTYAANTSRAWLVPFYDGFVQTAAKYTGCQVRCARRAP